MSLRARDVGLGKQDVGPRGGRLSIVTDEPYDAGQPRVTSERRDVVVVGAGQAGGDSELEPQSSPRRARSPPGRQRQESEQRTFTARTPLALDSRALSTESAESWLWGSRVVVRVVVVAAVVAASFVVLRVMLLPAWTLGCVSTHRARSPSVTGAPSARRPSARGRIPLTTAAITRRIWCSRACVGRGAIASWWTAPTRAVATASVSASAAIRPAPAFGIEVGGKGALEVLEAAGVAMSRAAQVRAQRPSRPNEVDERRRLGRHRQCRFGQVVHNTARPGALGKGSDGLG